MKYVSIFVFLWIMAVSGLSADVSLIKSNPDFSDKEKIRMTIDYLVNSFDNASFSVDEYLIEVDEIMPRVNNDSLLAVLRELKGRMLHLRAEYPKATSELTKALKYYERIGDYVSVVRVLISMCEIYRGAMSYESAIEYANKALDLNKKKNATDSFNTARAYNRLAAIYYEMKKMNDAVDNAELALRYATDSKAGNRLRSNTYNILGAVYKDTESDKALDYLNKSIAVNKIIENYIDLPNAYINIASIYYNSGRYEESRKYAQEAVDLAFKYNVRSFMSRALYHLAYSQFKLKDYDKAFKNLNLSQDYRDSMYDERKSQQLIEMKTKYEVSQKETEISNQKTIQMYQGIAFAGIILVILLLTLNIIFRNKTLSRTNSELELMNEIVTNQNDKLAELNATKDKFFSIIAHDLKNPLGSIKLTSNMLKDNFSELDENDKIELVGDIKTSVHHITDLLDNLLTWSRSQTGKIVFVPSNFQWRQLVESNLSLLRNQADLKQVRFVNNSSEKDIYADPNMLNTILRNIISNAIKYSKPNGEIIVEDREHIDNDIVYLEVSVKDNGIGISQENLNKLFKIESGFSTPGTNSEKGTGLGLILCKEFIEIFKGSIWAESELGKGTIIKFRIPVNQL